MNTPNVMTYKGFAARVEFDAEDGLFVGHLAGIDDVIGFHSDTVPALVQAFRKAIIYLGNHLSVVA